MAPGSIFAPYEKRLGEVADRYGVEKVAECVDKLDWQYKQSRKPIRDPIALLVFCLKKGMVTPTGYQTPQEREAQRLEKVRRQEAVRQEEERQRQEAEARRQQEALEKALWEALPEEERALLIRQMAPEVPEVCRSEFLVEMLAQQRFLEQRASIG